jgi:hypothetical protein
MDTTLTSDPAWRIALRPLITARGWTSLTHHLLGLPLGTAYFIWLVTGLSTGLGLAITIVGIPLLTLVLAATRPLLMLERGLANALLGTHVPPIDAAPEGEGVFGRFKATGPTARPGAASATCSRAFRSALPPSRSRSPPSASRCGASPPRCWLRSRPWT